MRRFFKNLAFSHIITPLAGVLAIFILAGPSWAVKSGEPPATSAPIAGELGSNSAAPGQVKIDAFDGDSSELLKKFYDRLAHVKDATSAGMLGSAIEMMWHRSGSDTIDLLMTRSLTAVNNQDAELALKLLDSVTELAPKFAEGWNRKAYVHFSQKQYGEALEDLRQALALDPRHFKAIDGLANVLRELGDKKRALQIYRTLIKVHPFWPGAKEAMEELQREVDGQEI